MAEPFIPSHVLGYDAKREVAIMRIVTACMLATLGLAIAGQAAALDCAHVRALHAEGKRASDIARELGITTPDVQACLAGAVEEAQPSRERSAGPPVAPQLPANDAPMPRPPNQ